MELSFTSFESVRASLFPPTHRTPGPVAAPAGAPAGAMVVRIENATLAEGLTLIPGLRAGVLVTVGRGEGKNGVGKGDSFLFHRGRLLGSADLLGKLRALLAEPEPVTVVMVSADELIELFETGVSVMEIVLAAAGSGARG